jgi:hypothetical protein
MDTPVGETKPQPPQGGPSVKAGTLRGSAPSFHQAGNPWGSTPPADINVRSAWRNPDMQAQIANQSNAGPSNISQAAKPSTPSQGGNAWATPLAIASNTPRNVVSGFDRLISGIRPTVVPTATNVMESISSDQNTPRVDPFDPDCPEFIASKYYIDLLRKYKCPHLGCG